MYLARKAYKRVYGAVLRCQAGYRGYKARKGAKGLRVHRAAVTIQKHFRAHKLRERFLRLRKAAVTIQTARRAQVRFGIPKGARMRSQKGICTVVQMEAVACCNFGAF